MQNITPSPTQSSSKRYIIIWGVVTVAIAFLTGLGVHRLDRTQYQRREDILYAEKDSLERVLREEQASASEISSRLTAEMTTHKQGERFKLLGEMCTLEQCLVRDHEYGCEIGTVQVEGYYTRQERTAWGATENCECLTFVGGSEVFAQSFRDLVNKGNSVQNLNDEGQPVVNLGIELLNTQEIEAIRKSMPDAPVRLLVHCDMKYGKGADICQPGFQVIRVLD